MLYGGVLLNVLYLILCTKSFTTDIVFIQPHEEDVSDLSGEFCQEKYSCGLPDIDDRNCNCDSECNIFKDCCYDVNTTQHFRTFIPDFKCEYVEQIERESFVFLVHSCPKSTKETLKLACQDTASLDSRIPVSGKESGYTYRNMFCAACNMDEFIPWQVGFSCKWRYRSEVNTTLESMQNDEHCSEVFTPPTIPSAKDVSFTARKCFPVKETCILKENAEKCEKGERELVFGENVYKNIDCAKCNGINTVNLTCSLRTWKLRPSKEKRKITTYSYRLLFDFNTNQATGTYTKRYRSQRPERYQKICPDQQVYDPFAGECRKTNCLSPLIYENGRCVYITKRAIKNKNHTNIQGDDRNKCVYILINETEYTFVNGTNMFIYSINRTLTDDDFYRKGDVTFVCKDKLQTRAVIHFPSSTEYHESESVLSFIGSVLSITALFMTLILYIRFPKLRNTPGKSLICLMSSLLIAQLLFLLAKTAEDTRYACVGFAVVIHYAFLASVFWMNCMSFDIFITFSKGFTKTDIDADNKIFSWYSVYAWSIPLIIVVSGICLDVFTINDYRPLYGQHLCWISNKRAILAYFLIPIGLVVVANIFFYVFTVRSIFISNRQTSKILRRKKSCKLLVYIKLSIVMGLTWVFAYVASLTNETVFWYIFIFFNSWQGVFIFISFVCFGKLRGYVLEKFSRVSSYFQSRTVTSSLTDSTKR